jgi:hypothetical protein
MSLWLNPFFDFIPTTDYTQSVLSSYPAHPEVSFLPSSPSPLVWLVVSLPKTESVMQQLAGTQNPTTLLILVRSLSGEGK